MSMLGIHSDFLWLSIWLAIILGASSRFLDESIAAETKSNTDLISCVNEIAKNFFRNRENVLIISAGDVVVAGEIFRLMAPSFAINLATKDSRINFGAIIDYIVLEGDDTTDAHEVVESMSLNPRGRYVIMTRDEPEDIEITAGRFWSAGIPNVIFVKPFIDGAMKVFGYGISSRPHHADVTLELQLLDRWEGKFTQRRNLFPNKFTNMNKYPLKVGMIVIDEWDIDMVVTSEHGEYKLTGIGSKILYEFTEKLNFKVVLSYGPSGENVSRNELIDRLIRRDIDITFAGINPYFPEVAFMDYSGPYLTLKMSFIIRAPRKTVAWNSMFKIFSIELWTSLLLALLVSLCLTSGIKKLWTMKMVKEYIRPLDVLKVYLVQDIVYPKHDGLRLALAFWMLYGYIMVAAFTGSLLKFLSMPHFQREPRNIEEVLNSQLAIIAIPELKKALLDTGDPDMMSIGDRIATGLHADEEERQFFENGLINAETDLKIAVYNWRYRHNESVLVRILDGTIFNYPDLYYMWKGHPYREPLDHFIGQAQSGGLIDKWISDSNASPVQEKTKNEPEAVVLSLEHLASVFFALACGWTAGIFTFLYELYRGNNL